MVNIKLVIIELHKAFHLLNAELFKKKLPEPAILVQNQGNRKNVFGWCSSQEIWVDQGEQKRYEINICAEYLNRSMIAVLTTLIHEMVHLHNAINGIQDTSRSGTYHNKIFKTEAENHGLEVQHDNSTGWSRCKMHPSLVKKVYTYGINESAFTFARLSTPGKEKKKTSLRRYVCPGCETIIRATKDVNVICADCNQKFNLETDDEDNTQVLKDTFQID